MADVSTGYVQGPGGFYRQSDRSGPYSIDDTGVATLMASDPAARAANSIVLFAARTTDGSPGGVDWPGGEGLLSIYGTWGAASVQLAYSPDGGTTYINTDGGLFSAV